MMTVTAQNQRGIASAFPSTGILMISRKATGWILALIALLIATISAVAVWHLSKLPPP